MKSFRLVILCGTAFAMAACATTPMGPTVQVLPPQGKPFEQFQSEDYGCRQYAAGQVQGQADAANTNGLLYGLGGTALGAGLGAAVGGGRGAAIGAAGGAVAGTAVGAGSSSSRQGGIQGQYNNAYVQCMVAKGNMVHEPPPRPAPTVVYQAPPPAVVYQAPPPTVIYTAPPPPPPPTVVYTSP
jgi:outer membrane lipoprotein SlyB